MRTARWKPPYAFHARRRTQCCGPSPAKHCQPTDAGDSPLVAALQAQSGVDHLRSDDMLALCAEHRQLSACVIVFARCADGGTHFEKRVALRVLLDEHAAAVPVVGQVQVAFFGALDLEEVAPALGANALDPLRGWVVECISDLHRRSVWLMLDCCASEVPSEVRSSRCTGGTERSLGTAASRAGGAQSDADTPTFV